MRLLLTFALTIMILNSFPITSQGIHNFCDQGLVKIAQINENDRLLTSCVTPNVAEVFSELGWYVTPKGSNAFHIIAEGTSIEETVKDANEEIDDVLEEAKETVTEGSTSPEPAQLIEDFSGGLGSISIVWKADNKAFSSSSQIPLEFLENTNSNRLKNMNMAYGELLKELGVENDPNLVNNKVEFLNYLSSSGWKLVPSEKISNRDVTLYQFEKVIIK